MTDTKPTLDEQIAFMSGLNALWKESMKDTSIQDSILKSLEELKRIRSAEMPEPVAEICVFIYMGKPEHQANILPAGKKLPFGLHRLYGPEVLAVIQRKDAEAQHQTRESFRLARLHERAEKEKAALVAKYSKLIEAAERTCIASSHGIAPISDLREALAAFKEKL